MKRISILLAAAIVLWGCNSDTQPPQKLPEGEYIYYLNSSATGLVSYPYKSDDSDPISGYLNSLSVQSAGGDYIPPLKDITVLSQHIENKKLIIDFGGEYKALEKDREILTRAAVVKTLSQYENISSIEFLVNNVPLENYNGRPVGSMDKSTFVDYFGNEQDSLIWENFTIYYVNSEGTGLVGETHKYYFDNALSYEQAVIKCMQEQPESGDLRIAISKNINIINSTITEGTCYLDMDINFYDKNSDIDPKLALMSIVNSLCELDNIRAVKVNIINVNNSEPNSVIEELSGVYRKDSKLIL